MKTLAMWLGAVVLMCLSAVVAIGDEADGLVVFINETSSSISISVDGTSVCSVAPAKNCSTVLTGNKEVDHTVEAVSTNGDRYVDKVKISECIGLYGTKTYTFGNGGVDFDCGELPG